MITIDLEAVVEFIVKTLSTLFVVSIAIFVLAYFAKTVHENDIAEAICAYSAVTFLLSIAGFLVLLVIAILVAIWSA